MPKALNIFNYFANYIMKPIISKLPNTPTNIFSVMSALALKHDAVNLGQGFADYSMNQELCNLVHKYMQLDKNQYAPMPGVPELREAIAHKINLLYNKAIDFNTEICITPGGTYAIYTALMAIVNKGDEVIVLEPAYDSYIPNIILAGGIPILVAMEQPVFKIDWQKVANAITKNTKAIILNTPHNPSGYTFTSNDWASVSSICAAHNIYIISDEVYEHIALDNLQHESILRYPELWQRTFAIFSFGKVYHNTGWKLGYCIAPHNLMAEYKKIHQYIAFTCNTPLQYALAEFLKNENEYLQLPHFFEQKRNLFLSEMQLSNFTLNQKANGSFFQIMGYENISNEPDTVFCERLTIENGVTAIPVSAFYKNGQDNKLIRFCFAKKEETLITAARKLSAIKN
jgi:methionine transaminase